jgi:hypothetical protein
MTAAESSAPTALARRLVLAGRREEAERVVAELIGENFGLVVRRAAIGADWSSLNSLNGNVEAADGRRFFFKFHQEEGEEATVEEYYRAELLQRAGLPVDAPLMVCREPGRQILLYAFRQDRKLADLCLAIERTGNESRVPELLAVQRELDCLTGETYLKTLHASDPTRSSAEAVHQLFHRRLVTPLETRRLGGRIARFYENATVRLPGIELRWAEFSRLRWRINGVDYAHTLDELFRESLGRLAPEYLAAFGAVTGHGDAHNANVWVEERGGVARLVLFDPAFAGEHMPALLAEVKATFHNIFAHPFWLYHPEEAHARYRITAQVADGRMDIAHDWTLTPLRDGFLREKSAHVWRPLLRALAERGLLPPDWTRIVRLALFCCPTLVMNLRAGVSHGMTAPRSPEISALSFAIAVMAGSEPVGGADPFSRLIADIAPTLALLPEGEGGREAAG